MNIDSSEKRSKIVAKQTILSFLFQVLSVGLNFLVVPLSISFFSQEVYGVWITLISVIGLIILMDFGIGVGFRNKLTESLAQNDFFNARKYIATAYLIVGCISVFFIVIGVAIIQFQNWNRLFNFYALSNAELAKSVSFIYITALSIFWLGLINQILNSLHKSSWLLLNQISVNSVMLILFFAKPVFLHSLSTFCLIYMLINIFFLMLLNLVVFKLHPKLLPKFVLFDKFKIKEIFNFGTKFFVIQLCMLVIFNTDNIIISNLLGPREVTSYQVTRQVFNFISTVSVLIMAPLWSAFTDAFLKNDINWIAGRLKFLTLLMIPLIICVGVLAFYSRLIIHYWIHSKIDIAFNLIVLMGIYTIILVWINIFGCFLNGISRINEQMICFIIAAIINIPLCILFVKYYGMGNAGVMLATIISISIFAVIGPFVTYKVIKTHKRAMLL